MRSKKLNKVVLQEKSVGRLTKIRRHTCYQHDADELGTFLWQTRSLKGYSFLTGVAASRMRHLRRVFRVAWLRAASRPARKQSPRPPTRTLMQTVGWLKYNLA
jgi:hypothetical protein